MSETHHDFFPDGKPDWVDEADLAARKLEGDEWLVIRPMLFSLRLAVMTAGDASVEHWCYGTIGQALVAFIAYPHDVGGWTRHYDRNRVAHRPE